MQLFMYCSYFEKKKKEAIKWATWIEKYDTLENMIKNYLAWHAAKETEVARLDKTKDKEKNTSNNMMVYIIWGTSLVAEFDRAPWVCAVDNLIVVRNTAPESIRDWDPVVIPSTAEEPLLSTGGASNSDRYAETPLFTVLPKPWTWQGSMAIFFRSLWGARRSPTRTSHFYAHLGWADLVVHGGQQ
jgi:hypothetical protein